MNKTILEKRGYETFFEWKLRLCLAKLNHELEYDWQEIADALGLDVSADHLRKTAYGLQEYHNYIKDADGVATSILSVSDLHVPFQLPLDLLESYRGRVDILQLNGDIGDMQAISKYSKSYRVSPMEEIIMTRRYIIDMINYLKPQKVVFTFGNHDLRYQSYLSKNLDCSLLELQPSTSLELIVEDGFHHYNKIEMSKEYYPPLKEIFTDVDIEYTANWFCQIGDCIFCHPSAYSSAPLKTAEKAMYYFRNEGYDFKKLVMAHTHRSGQYTIGDTTIYEQGCFCDVSKNNYADGKLINSQKEGFIFLQQDKNGRTIDGKVKLVVLN